MMPLKTTDNDEPVIPLSNGVPIIKSFTQTIADFFTNLLN
jgi:hypothetical protein